jgi:hypothetical protein
MLVTSGRAAFIVALHMPHFTNRVKAIPKQSEIILNLPAILRRFSSDLADTLRDTETRIPASQNSKTLYV